MDVRPKKNQKKSSESLPCALVAGGAGFIGSHLCEILLAQNCLVYCLDNLTTGKKQNLKDFWNHQNFFFVQHDLNQVLDAKNLPQFDYIFHLAGIEAYINSQNVSLETLLVNSLGTKNLLELAHDCQAKFLLGSSPKVYEGFLSSEELKDYFGKKPQSDGYYSHSEAKRFSEALTFEYFKTYNLNARVVRIADVYGPRMSLQTGGEISELFWGLKENQNLPVPGEGLKISHPVYVSDLIWGVLKAMFGQTTSGYIYTLVGPDEITVVDFAKKLIDLSKKDLTIEYTAPPTPQKNLIDKEEIIKTSQMLSWQPKVSLEEGIGETLAWLENSKKVEEVGKVEEVEKRKIEKRRVVSKEVEGKRKKSRLQFFRNFRISKLPKFHPKLPNLKIKLPKLKIKLPKSRLFPKKAHLFLLIFLLLFFIFLGPVAFFCFNVLSGVRSLQKAENYLKTYNFDKGKNEAVRARLFFKRTKGALVEFSWLASGLRLTSLSEKMHAALQAGDNVSQTIIEGVEAIDHANRLVGIVLKGESGNIQEEHQLLTDSLNQAYEQLGFLKTSLESSLQVFSESKLFGVSRAAGIAFLGLRSHFGEGGGDARQRLSTLEKNIGPIREMVISLRQFLNLAPQLLAFDTKKTYLVLLQNNMELRATGGFIGSYAFLTFEKGKLLDFKVEDVYTADGQLKGYVKPPEAVKKYLGEDIWYFRDSNFEPNFPTAAQQAEWFVQKELGRKVDGVVGINLSLAQNLLSVLGPVQLLDYKELITADNVFERAEYHSEVNFFPGSTQKKDFLGSLATGLFEKSKRIEEKQWVELAKALKEALERKQILFYFHDKKLAELVNFRGWDGSIRQLTNYNLPYRSAFLLKDYLMIVESNFGVNKANYFVQRKINHEVTIHKIGEVNEALTISYENTSQSESWPGGLYKNYLRILIPFGSKLGGVLIGENENSLKSVPKDKIDVYFKDGKNIVAFLVEVPARERRVVKVGWQLKEKMDFQKKQVSYAFLLQKQPGTEDDPFTFQITHPGFAIPLKVTPPAKVFNQLIKFSSDTSRDQLFIVDFAQ